MKTTIVENINAGVKVNEVFNQFIKVRDEKEHAELIETLRTTRFGTYGTFGIMDIIKEFQPGSCNEWIKREFIKLVVQYN